MVTLVFMGAVWAGENKAVIKNFKKKNPTVFVVAVMGASYFLVSLFGGVMVFIFGITFPILCKFVFLCYSPCFVFKECELLKCVDFIVVAHALVQENNNDFID